MPWVQAARTVTSGLDADKPTTPAVGDMYGATDTRKVYMCFTAGTWNNISYLANSGSGTLAELPASPGVGDTFYLTGAMRQLVCFSAGVWTNITKRVKTGSFSRDLTLASGNQAVTGVGFKPSFAMFIANRTLTNEVSIGMDNGTSPQVLNYNVPGSNWVTESGLNSIYMEENGVLARYYGNVTSFDSDGFTIAWTKLGTPAGTAVITYYAFEA